MKFVLAHISQITLGLLVADFVVLSVVLAQGIAHINMIPKSLESFAWALVAAFQVLVVTSYLMAILSELRRITKYLGVISGANHD